MALTFEWDGRKAAVNLANHGVSFDEALTVFADPLGRLEDDDRHSVSERRLVLLGRSSLDRLLAVMFTERGPDRIRLISARHATRSERRQYEEARK
ncbi:MAG: BrnT family toxin [Gemmatimonadaceae bacterium]